MVIPAAHGFGGRLAATIIVVACTCLPAGARADLSWSTAPQTLTASGTTSADVHVVSDAAGNALAVWLQGGSAGTFVAAAQRPAGSNFGAPFALSCIGCGVGSPTVAMNAHGDAIVAWTEYDGGLPTAIYYRTAPAGGKFGFEAQATDPVPLPQSRPQVFAPAAAIDGAGDAIIAWSQDDGQRIVVAYRPAGTSTGFDPAGFQTVSQGGGTQSGSEHLGPSLAMDTAGNAIIAWDQDYAPFSPPNSGHCPEAAFRPAGGDPSHPLEAGFGPKTTLYCDLSPAQSQPPWSVSAAIDAGGNSLVAYAPSGVGNPFPPSVHERYRTLAGAWSVDATLGPGELPTTAFDPSGDAWVLWRNGSQVQYAYQASGGSFGTPGTVASSPDPVTLGPELGVDSQGRPAAIWALTHDNGDGTTTDYLQASSRVAGPGAWAAHVNFDQASDLTGLEPSLSVSAPGRAVAMWSSVGGNADPLVRAAFGTPPGLQPPPPPPPPPPPEPSSIVVAGHYTPGGPLVLTAHVPSDTQTVHWELPGAGGDVIGKMVDGHLQDSVRLHPASRNFGVRVFADGPGGESVLMRGFVLPKAPRLNADQQHVHNALGGEAPVFAVGTAPILLGTGGAAADHPHGAGDPGCGKVTVFSAAQQLTGCMRPANLLSSIPDRERGVLEAVAGNLGLDPNDLPLMQDAVSMMDGYVSEGRTMIDDNWPVVPQGAADVMAFPQAQALTSSSASLEVAGQKFGLDRNGFSMNLDPRKADIPLGDLPKPPKFPSIGGFEVVGDWNVDLGTRTATITASLKLPSWITAAGINVQNSVTFKATPDRLILQDVKVGPMSVDLGGTLGVQDFKLTYDEAQDEWTGQGKACVIPDACLDLVPPNGEIKIKNGQLEFAGASVDFPPPGVPLFPLVNLERLGFGIGLDPTRITGNGRVSVARIVKLDGRMVMAFPSDRTPFFLKPDEVGGGFPGRLYGIPFTRFTLGATAAVIVDIPDVVTLELGHGYFLYQYPSYVAVGGGIDQTLFDFLRFYGNIGGEANFSDGTINLHGDIHGCIEVGTEVCGGIVANASHGPGNIGGIGGCIELGDVHVGGGIQWNRPFDPFIWPLDGCKWSRFAVTVNTASDAAAGRVKIKVVRGRPSPAVEIYGSGAAPLVRVTGPGGQRLDSTTKGLDVSANHKIRIIRYHGKRVSLTVIGIQNDKPGTYTIAALPGSVPFLRIARATDLPNARITGHVTGSGVRRVLSYRILRRPGQTVTFYDLAEGGTARGIGTVRGGGHGRIAFITAPGRARHTILAQFSLAGLPAERITFTSFRPPSPRLPKPAGLHVKRRKTTLTINWKPVPDATSYQVAITSRTGLQRVLVTRGHRVVLRNMPAWLAGYITVRAVDSTRRSPVSVVPLRGTGKPPRKIKPLGHCTVRRHKITCKR